MDLKMRGNKLVTSTVRGREGRLVVKLKVK